MHCNTQRLVSASCCLLACSLLAVLLLQVHAAARRSQAQRLSTFDILTEGLAGRHGSRKDLGGLEMGGAQQPATLQLLSAGGRAEAAEAAVGPGEQQQQHQQQHQHQPAPGAQPMGGAAAAERASQLVGLAVVQPPAEQQQPAAQALDSPPDGWRLPPDGSGCQRMLWFTAIGGGDMSVEYQDYVKVALLSARQHAPSLLPVLIHSGSPTDLTRWWQSFGGLAVHHRLSFLHAFEAGMPPGRRRNAMIAHEGVWLRLDVPMVMDEIVQGRLVDTHNVSTMWALYTDLDVTFMGGGPAPGPHPGDVSTCTVVLPPLFTLGPEGFREQVTNSGVMVIQVEQMRKEMPSIVQYANSTGWSLGLNQATLIAYLEHQNMTVPPVPPRLNYKAYWGDAPTITLVHWHGPKPRRCTPCFLAHVKTADWEAACMSTSNALHTADTCQPAYLELLRMAVAADNGHLLETMLHTYDSYLALASMQPAEALSKLGLEQPAGTAAGTQIGTTDTPTEQQQQLLQQAGGAAGTREA
ncbi:Glycosyl transferase family 8 [Micractinium conductrix]|uniref:Glycosyl transferase family 8 n=1 Tax=Micractinium conductrix TaxID=554055 RepID=A0A2P6V982_9CHLO|nr:Glycosyl transferase family 8 [Micractinium conductrix]|eukprot:PSC70643.1 Glycosyl transferase family 8 [Micractinium conductrix]